MMGYWTPTEEEAARENAELFAFLAIERWPIPPGEKMTVAQRIARGEVFPGDMGNA